jgi:transposase InsO family protein
MKSVFSIQNLGRLAVWGRPIYFARTRLIHDNALMFTTDYLGFNLASIRTGVEAPTMNSIMERFLRTLRREALDNFPLIGRSQIKTILEEYVAFYNSQRPHQGIQQQIPKPVQLKKNSGPVCRSAVLGGLHHHYYRRAA